MSDALLAQQRLMQAIQNYQQGDLETAEKELQALHQKFPKSDQILSLLGTVLFAQKKFKESFRSLKEALKINPNNEEALIAIGSVEKVRGNIDSAIALMTTAVQKLPKRPEIHYNLGTVYYEKQEWELAEKAFLKCLEADDMVTQANMPLFEIYKNRGDMAKAEKALRNALKYGHVPQVQQMLNELLHQNGNKSYLSNEAEKEITETQPPQAEAEPQQVSATDTLGIDENDIEALMEMANMFQERYQMAEAEKYLKLVLEKQPDHAMAIKSLRKLNSYKIPGWHFDMLQDSPRNDAYQKAIENALAQRPEATVLDIGTGSSLLAMMSVRAGAKHVLACEMHKELSGVAKEIVKANGFENQISVVNKKSTDLKAGEDFTEKFDIVVSEILDCGGLGEGVLPSLRHAKSELLKPDGIMLPLGITLYGQFVEVPIKYKVNPIREISGFDLSAFQQFKAVEEYSRIFINHEKHHFLSEPFKIRSYNFNQIEEAANEMETVQIKVNEAGNLQAVLFWFHLHMDSTDTYSSAADGEFEHWGQAIYYFDEAKKVSPGNSQGLEIYYTDTALHFKLEN